MKKYVCISNKKELIEKGFLPMEFFNGENKIIGFALPSYIFVGIGMSFLVIINNEIFDILINYSDNGKLSFSSPSLQAIKESKIEYKTYYYFNSKIKYSFFILKEKLKAFIFKKPFILKEKSNF